MEMEAKLREIIATLFRAVTDGKGGSRKKSKTTVFPPFPTSVQEDVFDVNDDQDYLIAFKHKFFNAFSNLDEEV